jgi:hypothetical protein
MPYKATFTMDTEKELATIIQACAGSMKLINVEHYGEAISKRRGVRRNGVSLEAIAVELFSDGKAHSRQELEKIFEKSGFAPTSSTPVLSGLRRAGRIVETKPQTYKANGP